MGLHVMSIKRVVEEVARKKITLTVKTHCLQIIFKKVLMDCVSWLGYCLEFVAYCMSLVLGV